MKSDCADFIINYDHDLLPASPDCPGQSPLALCLRRTVRLPDTGAVTETDSSITAIWHDRDGNAIATETYAINPETAFFLRTLSRNGHHRRQASYEQR